MKGLLLKDIYTLVRQFKIFLIIIVVFSVWPGSYMSGFAVFYASMLPITALAYDERSKWDKFAAMLPCSSYDIAGSKYLLGFISVSGALLLSVAGRIVSGYISGSPFAVSDLLSLVILGCVALILQAVTLPLMFRFGVEKGRLFFLAIVVIATVFSTSASEGIGGFLSSKNTYAAPVVISVAAAAIAVNIFSIRISAGSYKKRNA